MKNNNSRNSSQSKKKNNTFYDLFIHELKDLYSAENQLIKALPRMAKAASAESLRTAFEDHLRVTEEQKQRLDEIFEELETAPRGRTCKAMQGLIEEGKDAINMKGDESVRDAALIAAAQRVEHYEIAGYGTVRAMASLLGLDQVAQVLQSTLDEEQEADQLLNRIAESEVNEEALQTVEAGVGASSDEFDDEEDEEEEEEE